MHRDGISSGRVKSWHFRGKPDSYNSVTFACNRRSKLILHAFCWTFSKMFTQWQLYSCQFLLKFLPNGILIFWEVVYVNFFQIVSLKNVKVDWGKFVMENTVTWNKCGKMIILFVKSCFLNLAFFPCGIRRKIDKNSRSSFIAALSQVHADETPTLVKVKKQKPSWFVLVIPPSNFKSSPFVILIPNLFELKAVSFVCLEWSIELLIVIFEWKIIKSSHFYFYSFLSQGWKQIANLY